MRNMHNIKRILFIILMPLVFLSCDRGDTLPETWQQVFELSTGNGIIQNQDGDFLVHSSREIAKIDKNGSLV